MISDRPIFPRRASWIAAAGLIGAGALAYSSGIRGSFIFDDDLSIVSNPTILRLWPLWGALHPPAGGLTVAGRPLLNLSFAVNYALGGIDVAGYHVLNLAIHVLAALTLFGLVRRTVRVPAVVAFAVAWLWELHPVQTESVQYIVQRAESLMGLFYLLTLYCFIRAFGPGGTRTWAGLSVGCCLLGMATKEVMVSAPVIVLLYDRTFVAGTFARAWRERRAYYGALAATWVLLAVEVIANHGRGGTSGFGGSISAWPYWGSQGPAILHYLRLMIWPYPLIVNYGTQWLTLSWVAFPAIGCVAVLLSLSVWAAWRHPPAGFAGLWFFAILAPTSLIPGGRQTLAEHRLYLATVPLIALAVIAAWRWVSRRAIRGAARVALTAAVLALGVGWGGLTWARCGEYRSHLALYTGLLAHRPGDRFALMHLGETYYEEGRIEESKRTLIAAIQQPDDVPVWYTLGRIAVVEGNAKEAEADFRHALAIDPINPGAHNDLGVALRKLGQRPSAIAEFRAALALDAGLAQAHRNLGVAEGEEGHPEAELSELEIARQLQPGDAGTLRDLSSAHNRRGVALAQAGKLAEAAAEFSLAYRMDPTDDAAQRNQAHVELMLRGAKR